MPDKKEKAKEKKASKQLKQFDVNAKRMTLAFWEESEEDQLTLPTYDKTESISSFIEQINGNKR